MSHPSSTPRVPEIIAHRGASRERRENTLAAFRRALELGADAIELDVHATSDGVVVVHHDPVLGADDGGLAGRPITAVSSHELEAADDEEPAVPTLAEVLALVGDRATVYVEIKGAAIERPVLEVIAAAPGARCAVHAFDHRVARRARDLAADLSMPAALPVGVLMVSRPVDPVAAMRAAGARDLWQHWELLDDELVRAVHAAGGRVIAWTVNDPAAARGFARLGVDGICSDVPDVIRAAVTP